ncbi:MAG: DUF4270 family protein [Rikenellaceae bacterium]
MSHSNLLRRLIGGVSVIAIVAIITFSGCTQVDTSLGSDLTLDNQSIKLGQMNINSTDGNYFESRLHITDSINTGGITYGYFGASGNDTFGTRRAEFFTQYIVANTLDDDIFGYMPIYDSAVLYLSINSYGGDTTISQQFEIYEIIDNSFITESADSIFFCSFDVTDYLDDDPIFTFTFPDVLNQVYVSTSYVKLEDTDKTADFIARLMLEEITGDYDEDIYEDDEEWVSTFLGLYIRPIAPLEPITAGNPGAIYETTLSSTGFGFYGRSREEDDITLIKDTIGMSYYFYSSYADYGNISINVVDYNFDGSLIDYDKVRKRGEAATDEQLTSTLRVEGMAGIVSEITITPEFLYELDTILDAEEAESGETYESLFFNQAKLMIYLEGIDGYDYTTINPYSVTPWLNYMPTKLGLYSDYSNYYYDEDDVTYTSLTGVADYLYAYESSYTLDFGGSLNRTWCCYVMNIPGQIQVIWNEYLEAKEEAEENGTEIDWDSLTERTIYLAPIATNLFSQQYASLQAGDADMNSAPMKIELTYTLIK